MKLCDNKKDVQISNISVKVTETIKSPSRRNGDSIFDNTYY